MVTNRFMESAVKIIYQKNGLMVVSKPAGMVTTNEGRSVVGGSLEDWSRERGSKLDRAGIVHRLDKGTSGLVMIALNEKALALAKKQFLDRKIEKIYWSLLSGIVPGEGALNFPIGRSSRGFGKFAVEVDGKVARTNYKVKKIFFDPNKKRFYSLVEVKIETGRTHQIRVHFSFLKLPIVGDELYGGEEVEGLGRQFLHAMSVSFDDPILGSRIKVEDQLADDLISILSRYEEK